MSRRVSETPLKSLCLRHVDYQLRDLLTECGAPAERGGGKESTASARGVVALPRDDLSPEDFVSFPPGERKIGLAWTRAAVETR